MKRIITLIALTMIFSSCHKDAYYPSIEHYYEMSRISRKWTFNDGTFGLDVHRPNTLTYWERCQKIGDYKNGYLIINSLEFEYYTNKDTVRLFQVISDIDPPVLKYTLILDKSQINRFGIFQK